MPMVGLGCGFMPISLVVVVVVVVVFFFFF